MTGASGAPLRRPALARALPDRPDGPPDDQPQRRAGAPRGAGPGGRPRRLRSRGPRRSARPAASSTTITRTSRRGSPAARSRPAGMVVIPCSMSTLGSIAGGDHDQPDHPRGRRSPEGAPQADPGPARDAAEPDPPGEHGAGHAGRRRRAPGDARLVSPPAPARGPDRLHRRPDLRPARHPQRPVAALGRRRAGPIPRTRPGGTRGRRRRDASRALRPRPESSRRPEPMAAEPRGTVPAPGHPDHRRLGRHRGGAGAGAGPPRRSLGPWC